ncbi:MAG TPA: hypothetical protein PKY46_07815 [Ignavibacteriaceae bacterium]|nr:hypothetical protein [Ignavibacteriaceae bacterium]
MNDIFNVLKEELQIVNEAARVMDYSFSKCSKINITAEMTDEEL